MKKKLLSLFLLITLTGNLLTGCGNQHVGDQDPKESAQALEQTQIQVFIAASLHTVMTDLAEKFKESNPNIEILFNADSSGTLLTQIEEGFACDIFFSAAQKQMDSLEVDGLILDGTRKNVVNNKVVVIARKNADTKVKGIASLDKASSIALAGGSVPVGKYTRQALVNLQILDAVDDVSTIETSTIQDKLGVEISEQSNVSKVLEAVKEGSAEVGTTYYSDLYGYEEQIQVIEEVDQELTGDVIYPICLVKNDEASKAETDAARQFYEYVISDEAKPVFRQYYFDTNVE